jgi:zinc and cadmium transporter
MTTLLITYCVLILLASLAGGWIPLFVKLTHRGLQLAVSFVSGVMLGIGLLHLLPHALELRADYLMHTEGADAADLGAHGNVLEPILLWMLGGFLVMFLIERFFCFHHHDVEGDCGHDHDHDHGHGHDHKMTWVGAAVGLTLHSVLAGVALAASVIGEASHAAEAGLFGVGTFLVIFLHKPFDSLTLGTLMATGGYSKRARHVVNGLFALAIPIGAGLLIVGAGGLETESWVISAALAVSAGVFLCISLSDLLPELQFHTHDRVKLTVALILGLVLAWAVGLLEASHHHGQPRLLTTSITATTTDCSNGNSTARGRSRDGTTTTRTGTCARSGSSLDPVRPTDILMTIMHPMPLQTVTAELITRPL